MKFLDGFLLLAWILMVPLGPFWIPGAVGLT